MDRDQLIYLDTHVLVRLYLGEVQSLGPAARKAIEEHDLVASPAAVLELELLHEIGRLRTSAAKLVSVLSNEIGLRICDLPFRAVVEHALKESWVRDPFDRMIVANAKAREASLVTKDEKIHLHYSRAIW
jgi:PIN domain nuclease of toxin-antitoxin system